MTADPTLTRADIAEAITRARSVLNELHEYTSREQRTAFVDQHATMLRRVADRLDVDQTSPDFALGLATAFLAAMPGDSMAGVAALAYHLDAIAQQWPQVTRP